MYIRSCSSSRSNQSLFHLKYQACLIFTIPCWAASHGIANEKERTGCCILSQPFTASVPARISPVFLFASFSSLLNTTSLRGLHICVSTEVRFDHRTVSEIPCLWNHRCGLIRAIGRLCGFVFCSNQTGVRAQKDYTVQKAVEIVLVSLVSQVFF